MTATCTSLTATTATVVLRPNWLARLFGKRTTSVNLLLRSGIWATVATVEPMVRNHVFHGREDLILDALCYRPVVDLPVARAVRP